MSDKENNFVKKEFEDDDNLDEKNVTREINLDDLYDGAINNTVVIDPITNEEILLPQKKSNHTIIGIILAIVALLALYYVTNKTSFGNKTKEVKPKTTTTIIKDETNIEVYNGSLTCTYNSKGDSETQNIVYEAKYIDSKITESSFNYVVVSTTETASVTVENLKSQYESFYINNASVVGNNVTFENNEKGFTFNVKTDYKVVDFNSISVNEGQTILYVKPNVDDTYKSIQAKYINNGFNCNISSNKE